MECKERTREGKRCVAGMHALRYVLYFAVLCCIVEAVRVSVFCALCITASSCLLHNRCNGQTGLF